MQLVPKSQTGDCECCDRINVVVVMRRGNTLMCDNCIAKEDAVDKAKKVVEESRSQDDLIQYKTDVYTAATVSFTELQAAIKHNTEIPDAEKDFALVKEASERIQKMNEAIFEAEAAIMEQKNQRHAWVINTQNLAVRLRVDQRAKFAQYDLSYTSPGITKKEKKIKAVTPSTNKIKFSKEDVYAAAKKYNVNAVAVQMTSRARNIVPDAAAKVLVELAEQAKNKKVN